MSVGVLLYDISQSILCLPFSPICLLHTVVASTQDQYALVYTADMAEVILRLLIKLVNASRSLLCSLDSPTTSSTSSSTSSSAQMIRQSQTQSASSTSVPLSSLSFPTPTEARHGSSSLTTTSPSLPSSAPSTSTTSTTPTSTFSSSLDTSPDPFHKMKRRYDEFSEEILEPDPMLGSSACLITESPPLKRNKLDVTASIIPTDQDLSSQMICSTSSAQDTQTSSSRPSSSSTSVSSTSPTTLQFPRDASMSPVTSPTWNCPSAISSPSSISITPTLSLLQDTGLPLRLVVNVLTRFLTDVLPSLTSLSTPRRQLMSMLLADPQHTLNHACDASVSSPSISLAASPVTFFSSPLYHVFLKSIPSSSELDDLEISAQRCLKALSKGGHPSLPLSPLVITPILSQISGSVTVTALDIQRFLTRFTFINPPTTSYDTPFMSASSILSPGSNSSASLSSSIPARHMTSVALTPSLNVSAAASRRRMAGALLSANQSSSTKDTLPSSLLSSISAIDPQPAVYEMCVPMSASIWADTLHGRKELLAAISRTHRGEISERQLFSKYARQSYLLTGSVLPVHFHYRDAVGLGLLTVRQTPLGPVAQVSQKAPSSQDSKLPSSSPTTQVLDDSSTNKSVLGLKPQEDSLGSGRVGASPSTGISGLVPSAALRRKAGLGIPAITRTALAKSLGSHAV